MEDKVIFDTDIEDAPKVEVPKTQKKATKVKARIENSEDMGIVSCLRNEKIKIKFIERNNGLPSNLDEPYLAGIIIAVFDIFILPIIIN